MVGCPSYARRAALRPVLQKTCALPGEKAEQGDAYLRDAKKARKAPAQPVQDPRLLLKQAGGVRSEPKPKPAPKGERRKKQTKKADKDKDDADAPSDEEGEDSFVDPDAGLLQLKKQDAELFPLARKHYKMTGKLSSCFFSLNVDRYLKGEKNLTPVLTGASYLIDKPLGQD